MARSPWPCAPKKCGQLQMVRQNLGDGPGGHMEGLGAGHSEDYAIEIDHAAAGESLFRIQVRKKPALPQS